MGSGSESPFSLEDEAPERPGCLIFGGFTYSPHPTNKKLGLDTIQAMPFFPWWLLLFIQEDFYVKGDL